MFMSIIRVLIAFSALVVLITLAFGEEMPASYYNETELLELERALEAEIAADAVQPQEASSLEELFGEEQPAYPVTNAPTKPVHIDLTGDPLNQPLSNTELQDAEGIPLTRTQAEGRDIYVMPEQEFLGNPTVISEVDEIGEISTTPTDLPSFGILTAENGGFEANLWQGMTEEHATKLLQKIQAHSIKSQTMRLLMQRALLTNATAPRSADNINNWLSERIKTLHSLGYAEAAHLLLKDFQSAWIAEYPDMAQVWVENLLMTGEPDVACQFIKQHILNENTPFWRQSLLVCQAIDRDVKGLQLSLDLASAEDKKSNLLLYQLLNALLSKEETPRLKPDQVFEPLHAVMYSYYPHLMTPDALIRLPDMLLRRIVENKALTESSRIQAAEKLVNNFAVTEDVQALISLYAEPAFSEAELNNPLGSVETITDNSLARALLWQGIERSQLASAKSLMIKKLWELAEQDGFTHIPALLTPEEIQVASHPNLAWFAPLAVKSYLKAGDIAKARNWWYLIENNKRPSKDLLLAQRELSPIFSLLDGQALTHDLITLIKGYDVKGAKDINNVQRILSTLEANNIEISPEVWLALHDKVNDSYVDQGKGPGQLWLKVLGSSLEKGYIGETILILAEPLVFQSPDKMMPQSLANIIAGLRFVSLPEDAERLSVETLLQLN